MGAVLYMLLNFALVSSIVCLKGVTLDVLNQYFYTREGLQIFLIDIFMAFFGLVQQQPNIIKIQKASLLTREIYTAFRQPKVQPLKVC